MPIIVVAIVSFACGWAIGACLASLVLSERGYRILPGVVAFGAGLCVFGIAIGEASHWGPAFLVEDALVEQRWCAVILWVVAGIAVYPFREVLARFLADLTALALKPPKSEEAPPARGKEADQPARDGRVEAGDPRRSKFLAFSLPWFIEAGLFGAILVAVVFAFNPKLLKGLTSLKAGGIEAHFAAAGPALQKGQIAVVDANRKSVLANWNAFQLMDEGHAQLYKNVREVDRQRSSFAEAYLRDQLKPVLAVLYRREFSYLKLSSENFGHLQDIATRLANQIQRDLDVGKHDKENTAERQVHLLNKVSQEIVSFICGTSPGPSGDHPAECDSGKDREGVACRATAAQADLGKCPAVPAYPAILAEHYKGVAGAMADNIWDPYVIQAVADLLGRSLGSRERANFLEVTTTLIEDERRAGTCTPVCASPVPGEMSLVYAAVEAKVESEHPWPFDHMFRQVSDLLAQTRRIIDDSQLSKQTRHVARRNRLIDLALGLQLFYQRALGGQRFTPAQTQSWSEWLKETRAGLSVLPDVGLWAEPSMDAAEKAAWRNALPTIERDVAVVQDAATSAALSSVLLPTQVDGTAGADCVKARTLIDFAGSRNLDTFYKGLRFDPDDRATYEGLIDQMKARVESECE